MIRILRTLDTLIFFVSKRSVMCTWNTQHFVDVGDTQKA
jgi:hypothetical protein